MKNAVCFYHTIIYWSFSPGTDTSFFLAAVTNLLKPSLCNDIARPARYVSEKKTFSAARKIFPILFKTCSRINFAKQKLLL